MGAGGKTWLRRPGPQWRRTAIVCYVVSDMQDYTRFVIITTGRTGSTWMVQALNSHSAVVCFGSPFEVGSNYVSFDVEGYDNFDSQARALRDRDGLEFLVHTSSASTKRTRRPSASSSSIATGSASAS